MAEEKHVQAARKIIRAQDRLLASYRTGRRPPDWVFAALDRYRPVWDAYMMDYDSRENNYEYHHH